MIPRARPRARARARARMIPRARARERARMMVTERANPRANRKETTTAAKARARRARPRVTQVGTAGEEVAEAAGIAVLGMMTGAILAATTATVEERAVPRAKGRERAKARAR